MDFNIADFTGDGSASGGNGSLLAEAADAGVQIASRLIPTAITNSPTPEGPKRTL